MLDDKNDNNFNTDEYTLLDMFGNNDPKHHEIIFAEHVIIEYPHLLENLKKMIRKIVFPQDRCGISYQEIVD
jgi:hypothetical protein